MTDPKLVTERNAVLRERTAYVRGRHESLTARPMVQSEAREYEKEAASRYPLPKVTRARVVQDPHDSSMHWRVGDERYTPLQFSVNGGSWQYGLGSMCATDKRVRVWADLLANPTEEVEDNG